MIFLGHFYHNQLLKFKFEVNMQQPIAMSEIIFAQKLPHFRLIPIQNGTPQIPLDFPN